MKHTATTTTADGTFTGTGATIPEAIRRAQYAAGTLQVWRVSHKHGVVEMMDIATAESELARWIGLYGADNVVKILLRGNDAVTDGGWIWTCIDPGNGGVNVHRS
jgi:SHS2 domain-containing protein